MMSESRKPMSRRQVDLIRLGFHLGQACEVCTKKLFPLYDDRLRALDRILFQFELDVANTIASDFVRRSIEKAVSLTSPFRDNALAQILYRGEIPFFDELFRLLDLVREPIRSTLSTDERNYFQIGELLAESERESDALPELLIVQENLRESDEDTEQGAEDALAARDLHQRIVLEGLDQELQQKQPFNYRNAALLQELLKPHGVILEELSRGPKAAMASSSDGNNREVVEMFDYPVDGWGRIDAYLLEMRPISSADPPPELEDRWVKDSHFKIEINEPTRKARKSDKNLPVDFSEAEWAVFIFYVKSRGVLLETASIRRELGIADHAYKTRKVSVRKKIKNLGLEFQQVGSRNNAQHRMQVLPAVQPPKPVIRTDGEA